MTEQCTSADALALRAFIESSHALFVLTGAGCSTPSGIPDYRDADGAWKRAQPMTYQSFVGSDAARRRYWARSLVGWPVMSAARPNDAHHALTALQSQGRISRIITQNVDGLHSKAGATDVIDLHGRLDRTICLSCSARAERTDFQTRLLAANPHWQSRHAELAPDGDADLDETDFSSFDVPGCTQCGGIVKPDVVFFGENVPKARVADAMTSLKHSDAVLIVGSSLSVFSGYRFARDAARLGMPIASLTIGKGRADDLLSAHFAGPCDVLLPQAVHERYPA